MPKKGNSAIDLVAEPEPSCEGFSLNVGTADISVESAKLLAQEVTRQVLGERWIVRRLGKDSKEFHAVPAERARIPSVPRAWNLVHKLRAHRDVVAADPLFIVPGMADPPARQVPGRRLRSSNGGDTHLPCTQNHDWGLAFTDVDQAWQLPPLTSAGRQYGEGILIGHPDTGYTLHPQLIDGGRVLIDQGYNFWDDTPDPHDELEGWNPGHGTSTGSVIMSQTPDSHPDTAVGGVAPAANLVPLRVTDTVVLFSYARLERALYYAADKGFHVVSISLGGGWSSDSLRRALQYATQGGVIVMAASGNYAPYVVYPATYDEAIAVCACNCRGSIWEHASVGEEVDMTAPGESIWRAAVENDQYTVSRSSGTSYAAAMTAGACALWLSFHDRNALIEKYGQSNLAAVFKEILMRNGVDRPRGWKTDEWGAGILNVRQLLRAPLPERPVAAGLRRLRAGVPQRDQNDFDRIMKFFPGKDPKSIRTAIGRWLNVDDQQLNALLALHGDELTFHFALNRDLTRELMKKPARSMKRRGKRGGKRAEPVANQRFNRMASTQLKALADGGH
jgi:thermitase